MFRPRANDNWRRSDSPTTSSHNKDFATVFTNDDSLRIANPTYSLEKKKPKNQIRIAVIGGSTVHIGTRFEVTLPGALKRALQSRYTEIDIEVINGGIISAISRQELIFLITTLVNYVLDILITYDGINDSGQMLYYEKRPNFPYNYRIMEEAWSHVAGKKGSVWREILSRSAIFSTPWPEQFGYSHILDKLAPSILESDEKLRRIYAEAHSSNWEKIRAGVFSI